MGSMPIRRVQSLSSGQGRLARMLKRMDAVTSWVEQTYSFFLVAGCRRRRAEARGGCLGALDVLLEGLAGELGEGDPAVAGQGIGLLAQLGGDAEADVG